MNKKEQVIKTIEGMRDEITAMLAELVRIPSVNPRYPGMDYDKELGGETVCNTTLADAYRTIGCQVDFIEKEKGRSNLVGVLHGSGGGGALIYKGELDGVPIGNPSEGKFQ